MKGIIVFMALCLVWYVGFEIELYKANKKLKEEAKEILKNRRKNK